MSQQLIQISKASALLCRNIGIDTIFWQFLRLTAPKMGEKEKRKGKSRKKKAKERKLAAKRERKNQFALSKSAGRELGEEIGCGKGKGAKWHRKGRKGRRWFSCIMNWLDLL